ncbi:PEGA domain-containing protein, partial [Anaeromyxobacter sp. Red801]|uniref:PEGA domain-containing protein n=1 Tax=Anaeromyxobacter sp. Red801 TaxID=3411632 RepID=UPI003BA1AC26
MRRALVAALCALAATGAGAVERLGVMAVADPPAGPDAELTELAHQLRAACRDRVGGVEEVATMRRRLLGQGSDATLSELDRAYGGALAVYQNGEFDSSVRTLRAIVDDLEALPEGEEAYFQWKRAMLRLAHASLSLGQEREMERAFLALARTDPALQPDPDQYSPGFRRRFEEVKARVRALPRRRLHVASEGRSGTVYVNGRAMGTTPVTLTLPAGSYRVGGGAGALRVPSFTVDLEPEDRSVVLDFALAEALRVNAGPGLALAPEARGYGIVRAGAWLGVDRLLTVSRAQEGQAQFLVGSIFDVRRGALLREGSVRLVAGGLPSVQVGALASFLLTGQSSRDVQNLTQQGPREIRPPLPPVAEAPSVPAAPPAVVPTRAAAPTPAPPVPAATAAAALAPRPEPARTTPSAPAPAPAPSLAPATGSS